MIISKLQGGLGNQMFQYAAGKSLAHHLSVDFYLDTMEYDKFKLRKKERHFELSLFGISNIIKPKWHFFQQFKKDYSISGTRPYQQPFFHFDTQFYHLPDNTHLIGFWQSEKYFSSIKEQIHQDFSFEHNKVLNTYNAKMMDLIKNSNSISMHIRRGDYVSNKEYSQKHGTLSMDYYLNGINYLTSRIQHPHFFIFSDDLNWVKNNLLLPERYTLVEGNVGAQSIIDMWLMSECQHNIIANSSFSWWGAWLNANPHKIVVAPKKWFVDPSHILDDILPSEWIQL